MGPLGHVGSSHPVERERLKLAGASEFLDEYLMTVGYALLGTLIGFPEPRAHLGCELGADGPDPDRPVTVVWLPDELAADTAVLTRLLRETAQAKRIDHPGVVRVHGVMRFADGWARICDFVDGPHLGRLLEGQPPDPAQAARLVLEVADAVHAAHEQGAASLVGRPHVHGSLRPESILVARDGRAAVTGFGAGALLPSTAHGVDRGGLARFLAPEQILGGKATNGVTTDVYALGALLYALLSGRPPFADAKDVESMVMTRPPEPIGGAPLRAALGGVAGSAMAKRAAERPRTARELADAVRGVLAAHQVALPTEGELAGWVEGALEDDAPERGPRRLLEDLRAGAASVEPLSTDEAPSEVSAELEAAAGPALRRAPPAREAATDVGASGPPGAPTRSPRPTAPAPSDPAPFDAPVGSGIPVEAGPVPQAPNDDPPTETAVPVVSSPVVEPRPGRAASAPPPPPPAESAPPVPGEPPRAAEPSPPTAADALRSSSGIPGAAPPHPSTADLARNPSGAPTPLPPPPAGYAYAVPLQYDPRTGQPLLVPLSAPIPVHGWSQPPLGAPGGWPTGGGPSPYAPSPTGGGPSPYAPSPTGGGPSPYAPSPTGGGPSPYPAGGGYPSPPLGNVPVHNLPPSARQPDPDSQISQFNRRAGDGSRSLLILAVLVAFGLIAFLVFAPGDPPEEIDDKLATELDRAAMREMLAHGVDPEPAVEESEEAELVEGEGTLVVETEPRVAVFLGDDRLGRTPLRTTVAAGRHRLRLTDRETGINIYRSVRVAPEGEGRLVERFGKAELMVKAPDGARIYLNGRSVAQAPLEAPLEIYEGSYVLKVNYLGKIWAERFEAETGKRATFDVREIEPR